MNVYGRACCNNRVCVSLSVCAVRFSSCSRRCGREKPLRSCVRCVDKIEHNTIAALVDNKSTVAATSSRSAAAGADTAGRSETQQLSAVRTQADAMKQLETSFRKQREDLVVRVRSILLCVVCSLSVDVMQARCIRCSPRSRRSSLPASSTCGTNACGRSWISYSANCARRHVHARSRVWCCCCYIRYQVVSLFDWCHSFAQVVGVSQQAKQLDARLSEQRERMNALAAKVNDAADTAAQVGSQVRCRCVCARVCLSRRMLCVDRV